MLETDSGLEAKERVTAPVRCGIVVIGDDFDSSADGDAGTVVRCESGVENEVRRLG